MFLTFLIFSQATTNLQYTTSTEISFPSESVSSFLSAGTQDSLLLLQASFSNPNTYSNISYIWKCSPLSSGCPQCPSVSGFYYFRPHFKPSLFIFMNLFIFSNTISPFLSLETQESFISLDFSSEEFDSSTCVYDLGVKIVFGTASYDYQTESEM